jgi:hypothetical protein
VHLGSYGPALREDLAFFFGTGLGAVDDVLRRLGDEIVQLGGPNDETYLDLADAPNGGPSDPGLRLLPEFDGLLVGYHGRNRTRFLTEQQLPKVWAKVNGLFSPVVLNGGQLVAAGKRSRRAAAPTSKCPCLIRIRCWPTTCSPTPSRPPSRFLTSRSLTCAFVHRYAEAREEISG